MRLLLVILVAVFAQCRGSSDEVMLLNVSYDPTRELYQDVNRVFAARWKEKTGQNLRVVQSHGGSSKQARAVMDGVEADVVTLGLGYDIDMLADRGLVAADWQTKFPNHSSPYVSTIVFLVRKGNPKQIKDWPDLIRAGVAVITPNPKTSGNGRWSYLAAYGFALRRDHSEQKAQQFVADLYRHVPVLDSGARGSTTTFARNGQGDVLIGWENEAYLALKEFGADQFEIVMPSESILAEPPVAVVDSVVRKKHTENAAKEYLQFLFSEEGQDIIGRHYYRPTSPKAAAAYAKQFAPVTLFSFQETFGTWRETQKKHFADGGLFDQIYQKTR